MDQQASSNQENRYRVYGIIGTILFHVALYLILKYTLLRSPIPPFPESTAGGGMAIEVNLGSSDEGIGDIQPEIPAIEKVKATVRAEQTAKQDKVFRTKTSGEQILASENGEATRVKITEKPAKKVIEAKPEPVINPNALYKRSANGGASQGITGRPGDQGVAGGIADSRNYKGNPGSGTGGGRGNGTGTGAGMGTGSGISYDLSGRSVRSLPKPSYNSAEQGRVVVTIWVNREGRVTRVSSGAKGTTVTDPSLIRQADSAARQALFSANPNGPEEQVGRITYNFIKLN